ncbi:MAG TPA: DsbA family protein [Acidimicrobiales bacterium]|nr:DsbA family protein [Acidimicrobiales bacterium]
MTTRFAVTWDYRCPFARNAHEHLLQALEAGAPWEVEFAPFSLGQVHVEEGQPDVWDDPAKRANLMAMEAGLVVRDRMPDRFAAAHLALFRARHDNALDLRDEAVLRAALQEAGVDADAVLAEIAAGWPLEVFRKEHEAAVAEHRVFGVPTFVLDDRAVFVRLMNRPKGDAELARRMVDGVLDLLRGWPELNEYKCTTIPR